MEPLSILVSALVAGAIAATTDVTTQAVKDGYAALKALILRKFGGKGDVSGALARVENKPGSAGHQTVLTEELMESGAAQDSELLEQTQRFLELLKKSGSTFNAVARENSTIVQGNNNVVGTHGGVAVGGNVQGDIVIGKE